MNYGLSETEKELYDFWERIANLYVNNLQKFKFKSIGSNVIDITGATEEEIKNIHELIEYVGEAKFLFDEFGRKYLCPLDSYRFFSRIEEALIEIEDLKEECNEECIE